MNATDSGTIDVTLPEVAMNVGDFVSVRGIGSNPWRIIPNCCPGTAASTDTTPQAVLTTSLNGNVTPGTNWTARMAPMQWHRISSNQDGSMLVAMDIPGDLHVSRDAGATWSVGNSPSGQAWVSAAVKTTPWPMPGAGSVHMVAVAISGDMYSSSDGVTWNQVTSTDPGVNLSARDWETVTMDETGRIIAAVVLNGPIYVSANGGKNWAAASADGSTTPLVRGWRAIASSAAGDIMVAASEDGEVHVSTTSGATWTMHNVVIDGTPVISQWYRAAMSSDGNTIAVAGRFDSAMYLSHDRGVTWSRANSPVGDYTTIAISSDGQVIGATLTNGVMNPTTGSVQLSTNGGASFAPLAMTGTDTNWRAMAMSADGNALTVAAGTFLTTTGQLYTSLGNRTSVGSLGSIAGGQNDFIEVEYMGNARFRVRSSTGGPFTIK